MAFYNRYVAVVRWDSGLAGGEVTRLFSAQDDVAARQGAVSIFREGVRCQILTLWELAREVPTTQEAAHAEAARIFEEFGRKKMTDFLEMSVEKLELSARTYNCLKNARIDTTRVLLKKSEDELRRVKNFGQKCVMEIKALLEPLSLKLGMTDSEIDKLLQRK
ncbi:MAG: DNA-directed RNA polymerase subunit alpha C-terminal domain-containing protein [Patescibacteria group bacterium]